MIRRFLNKEQGSTAIEYGLICALLVMAVAAVLPFMGSPVAAMYQRVLDSFR